MTRAAEDPRRLRTPRSIRIGVALVALVALCAGCRPASAADPPAAPPPPGAPASSTSVAPADAGPAPAVPPAVPPAVAPAIPAPAAVASPPASAPVAPAPASDPSVMHETFLIDSKVLGETRRINVYVPPDYYTEGSHVGYPILYMPDGGLEEDFPHVTADIDSATRAGQMRPVIVVGIENTERRRDMTDPTEVESDKKIAPHVGGAESFRAFIRDELMPRIRKHYRGDGRTAIVGESLAGLFVLETFFAEPQLFNTYIALSPSLWWNAQALVKGAAQRLKDDPGLTATLFFATASDDGTEDAVKTLLAALRASAPSGLTWYYEPRPDLQHATIYRGASPAAFRKLFPAGDPPRPSTMRPEPTVHHRRHRRR